MRRTGEGGGEAEEGCHGKADKAREVIADLLNADSD